MNCLPRLGWFVALLIGVVTAFSGPWAAGAELSQDDLTTLLKLGIDEQAIVAKIQKDGVAFAADEETLARLKAAGASDAVLRAVADSSQATRSPAHQAVTYDDVVKLLGLGIEEEAILARLNKSPTVFTFSAEQVAALKRAGASERLLRALQGARPVSLAAAELITDIGVVLDCSGSMSETTSEGETKMTAAKRVVTDLVQKIPEGMNVTFIVYGHEVFGSADDPRNCQAVKVVRPLSRLDASGKSELDRVINGLKATGATPIALSLKTAGAELAKNSGYCGLVLITDGMETCHGDPAAEAAALAANPRLTFGVNVVGFDVTAAESKSLKGIADAGKGKYYNALSAKELAAAIAVISQEIQVAARPPEVVDTSRRALRIVSPEIELPPMQEVFLVAAGDYDRSVYSKVGSISKFGEFLPIPSSTRKYDVVWVPKPGRPVYLMRDYVLAERRVVDVKPETILGMIQVDGSGKAQAIIVMPSGEAPRGAYTPAQQGSQYGEQLVVPAGDYDIYVDDAAGKRTLLEEGLHVEAGKLYTLQ